MRLHEAIRDRVAQHCADADRREQRADDLRVTVVPHDDQHGERDEDRLPGDVADDQAQAPRADQRLPRDPPQPGAQAAVLLLPGPNWLRLRRRHEEGDERDGDDVGRSVDGQNRRRSDEADQHAGDRRPEQERDPLGALEERACLTDDTLVLAEELRDDDPLGGEVRRRQRADRESDADEHAERQRVRPVQHRDHEHQGSPSRVADHHRASRADAVQQPEAEQPEQRQPEGLRRDHDAHARRRPARRQHEPGQRDPRHLRARRRNDLSREEGEDGAVPERPDVHHAASATSRRRGIGERKSQRTPASAPSVPIQSVVWRPSTVPSAPPSSAPIGRIP